MDLGISGRRARSGRPGSLRAPGASAVDGLARLGFAVRGVIYVVIGLLAVMTALGYGRHDLDRTGALAAIAGEPFGGLLLWLVVIGFAGLALWRAVLATASGRGAWHRVLDAARALAYAVAAWSTYQFVAEGRAPRSSDQNARDASGQLMQTTGGRVLLVVLSAVVIAVGVALIARAVGKRFAEQLRTGWMGFHTRKAVLLLGQVGQAARGVVVVAVGVFALYAALTAAPERAKGLDATLYSFVRTPSGPLVLFLVALGLVAFGLYSFAEARWRRMLRGVPR